MKKYFTRILPRTFFIFHFLFFTFQSSAQDIGRLRISLLTCTPGEELYSTFGHSAFRVVDSSNATDIVYNYGTFNFDDDGFYLKFLQGKLLYYVATERFDDFVRDYQYQNRGITEQVLNLSATEKASMHYFLNENIKEGNKYYKYDFFFDNCTTRLRDIIKKQHDSSFCDKAVMPAGTRFRQAIHQYLDRNNQPWSKLGIDILLGQPCDAAMTAEQMQFLPDNLMKSIDSSTVKLALTHEDIYEVNFIKEKTFFTPFIVFSILLIFIMGISLFKNKIAAGFIKGFDAAFFFLTGFVGILLIFMWLATDHSMCSNNFNLLWAWPTHIFITFFVISKKGWVKKYFAFTTIALTGLLLTWLFLPQQMNNGLVPIVLLLIYRSGIKGFSKH